RRDVLLEELLVGLLLDVDQVRDVDDLGDLRVVLPNPEIVLDDRSHLRCASFRPVAATTGERVSACPGAIRRRSNSRSVRRSAEWPAGGTSPLRARGRGPDLEKCRIMDEGQTFCNPFSL